MDNKAISQVFDEMADILDIKNANVFRINAYRRAAMTVLNLSTDLRKIADDKKALEALPGIGKDLSAKIQELIGMGHCQEHDRLKKSIPAGLLEMLKIRSLGPKKVKIFFGELGIKSIKELKRAAKDGVIAELEGMGEKSQAVILKAIEEYSKFSNDRFLIREAEMEAERIIEYLKKLKSVKKIEYAGSLRRRKDTIGDIDILVVSAKAEEVMDRFVAYDDVLNVIANGKTKSTIMLTSGMHVDLRVVEAESFGAAMHYFTGSKAHNIKIRDLAKRKGLKVNEYGVFKGEKRIGGEKEEDIFKAVGLPYIIPEIRRNDGEIQMKKFPKFVEEKDIRGDLHCHSTYSDGKFSIEDMVKAGIALGYKYIGISDHSSLVKITKGMGTADIKLQWKEIDKLQKKYKKIKILKSSEVDILKDGALDFPDEVLKELDYVIISAHMYQNLDRRAQTERLITAVENKYVDILAHPTGRLINRRAEMDFDMGKVLEACKKNGVALEINSSPQRLDLVDKYVQVAKDMGCKFVINTDAHTPDQLSYIHYGIGVARRGWLEKKDVLNTLTKFR